MEWSKLTNPDEIAALGAELVHIHNTEDKKSAPHAYDNEKHWEELVTNEDNETWEGQEKKIVLTFAHTWKSCTKRRLLCVRDKD